MDAAPSPAWARHLPPGLTPDRVDLLAQRSLPAAWARQWARDPSQPTLHDDGRWIRADELEERSRVVAGRFARAGLAPGDRVVVSAGASSALVIAHVAALRLGLIV